MPPEIQEDAKALGSYLAELLDSSSLSQEQKQAWASLVPEMDLEQMLKFAVVLEKYVPSEMFQDLIALRNKLQSIKDKFDQKSADLEEKTMADLQAVLDEASKAEVTSEA